MSFKEYQLNYYVQGRLQKGNAQEQSQLAIVIAECLSTQDRKLQQQLPNVIEVLCYFHSLQTNIVQNLPKLLDNNLDPRSLRILYYLMATSFGPGNAGTPQLQFHMGYANDIVKQISSESLRRSWTDALNLQGPFLNIKYALRNIAQLSRKSLLNNKRSSPYPQELANIINKLYAGHQNQISNLYKPQKGSIFQAVSKQEGLMELFRTTAQVTRFALTDKELASVAQNILELTIRCSDVIIVQHGIGTAVEMLKNSVIQESVTKWFVNFCSKFVLDYDQYKQQPGTSILRHQLAQACGIFLYGPEIQGQFTQQYFSVWHMLGILLEQDPSPMVNLEAVKSLLGGQQSLNLNIYTDKENRDQIISTLGRPWENILNFTQMNKQDDYLGNIARIIQALFSSVVKVLCTGQQSQNVGAQIQALQLTGLLFKIRAAYAQSHAIVESIDLQKILLDLKLSLTKTVSSIKSQNLKLKAEASVAIIMAQDNGSTDVIATPEQIGDLNSIVWQDVKDKLGYEQFNEWPQYVFKSLCDSLLLKNQSINYLLDCGLEICIKNPQHIFPQDLTRLWIIALSKYQYIKDLFGASRQLSDAEDHILFAVMYQAIAVLENDSLLESEKVDQACAKSKHICWENYQVESLSCLQKWIAEYYDELQQFSILGTKPQGGTNDQIQNNTAYDQDLKDISIQGISKSAFRKNTLLYKLAYNSYSLSVRHSNMAILDCSVKVITTCAFLSDEPLRFYCYSLIINLNKIKVNKEIMQSYIEVLDEVYSSHGVFVPLLKQYGTQKDSWPHNRLLKVQDRHKYLHQRIMDSIGPFRHSMEASILPFGSKSKALLNLTEHKVKQSEFVKRLTNQLEEPYKTDGKHTANSQPQLQSGLSDFGAQFGSINKQEVAFNNKQQGGVQNDFQMELLGNSSREVGNKHAGLVQGQELEYNNKDQLKLVQPAMIDDDFFGGGNGQDEKFQQEQAQEQDSNLLFDGTNDRNDDLAIFNGNGQDKDEASQGKLMVSGDNLHQQSQQAYFQQDQKERQEGGFSQNDYGQIYNNKKDIDGKAFLSASSANKLSGTETFIIKDVRGEDLTKEDLEKIRGPEQEQSLTQRERQLKENRSIQQAGSSSVIQNLNGNQYNPQSNYQGSTEGQQGRRMQKTQSNSSESLESLASVEIQDPNDKMQGTDEQIDLKQRDPNNPQYQEEMRQRQQYEQEQKLLQDQLQRQALQQRQLQQQKEQLQQQEQNKKLQQEQYYKQKRDAEQELQQQQQIKVNSEKQKRLEAEEEYRKQQIRDKEQRLRREQEEKEMQERHEQELREKQLKLQQEFQEQQQLEDQKKMQDSKKQEDPDYLDLMSLAGLKPQARK